MIISSNRVLDQNQLQIYSMKETTQEDISARLLPLEVFSKATKPTFKKAQKSNLYIANLLCPLRKKQKDMQSKCQPQNDYRLKLRFSISSTVNLSCKE